MERLRPFYEGCLAKAEDLLGSGWKYTNALPHNEIRVRLACAWPVLIGLRTIARLRFANVLDEHRIRVSRSEVRFLVLRSLLCYPRARSWNRLPALASAPSPHYPPPGAGRS